MVYDVHIFTVVRVKLEGIDAATPEEAITVARGKADFYVMFNDQVVAESSGRGIGGHTEWAEEDSHYMVDVVGDEEYENTQYFLDAQHVVYQQKMLDDGVDQWEQT